MGCGGAAPKRSGGAVAPAPPAPAPPTAWPTTEDVPGNVGGRFVNTPSGVILHGTRSGRDWTTADEYRSTVRYVQNGAGGLGWNITVGSDVLAVHMQPDQWGWNARAASSFYLACEFAQATINDPITDGQVRAFCWWFAAIARKRWPALMLRFPMHSELAEGVQDGKSDAFKRESPEANELRARILAELKGRHGIRA